LWIELEVGDDGPRGSARDDAGRLRFFSGWLELIALIESPRANGSGTGDGSSLGWPAPSTPDRTT
jgi:hypothetical protein